MAKLCTEACMYVHTCVALHPILERLTMLPALRFGSIFHYDMKLFRQRFLGENDDVADLN
jgi:hypothetical protein